MCPCGLSIRTSTDFCPVLEMMPHVKLTGLMRLLTLVDFGADCVAVADFNDDGAPEYVVGRAGSTQLAVYDTPGEGSRRTWIELDSFPVAMIPSDFDADGISELAVALIDARLSVFVADQSLNFSLARTIALPAPPRCLAAETIDGRPHLIVATPNSIHVLDPLETEPDIRPVSASVAEVAEQLEGPADMVSYDTYLAQAPITRREREVVSLAVRGMHAREIGTRLFIGERTVETHLAHAYSKLGVRSRVELLMRLPRRGRFGIT